MRKPCSHGIVLPRGLKCDRGYLFIQVYTDQGPYLKGCGAHIPSMEKVARLALEEIRIKQKLGTFNLPSKIKRILFDDAADYFQQKHFVEFRDPKTNAPRSQESIKTNRSRMAALKGFFGNYYLDAITVPSLKVYRKKRLEYDGVEHGTVNRDMSIMGSLINCFKSWNLAKEIEPVALPKDETGHFINPCQFLPDLQEIPRNRVATDDEIRRLNEACRALEDPGMWAVIGTELHSALRKTDLVTYLMAEAENGYVTLTQSKTGLKITLPKVQDSFKFDPAKLMVNFDSRWNKVRQAAGVPDLQFRDLRKTVLRSVHDLGFTVAEVSTLAGHANEKTTQTHYLDMTKSQMTSNTRLVDALKERYKEIAPRGEGESREAKNLLA